MPALVVVNVICIILGVFVTSLPVSDYLSNHKTWTYFIKNSTLVKNQFTLPGVFTSLKDDSVNASIWTILIEVKFYVLLFLGAYPILTRKWLFLALFILFQALRVYISVLHKAELDRFDFDIYFTYGTYFYLGSLFYCFKEDIPLKWFYANLLMAIALITVFTFLQPITESLFFAYCFLIIGNSKAGINLRGYDISYGLYLYAFPIQQLVLLHFGYHINPLLHIVISTAIALVPAFLSWIFVERPMLHNKNRRFILFNKLKV
jgi:peptidoglycan/LPS O-acetylase OafA/YrhL